MYSYDKEICVVQSSLPNEAVYEKEKNGVTVCLLAFFFFFFTFAWSEFDRWIYSNAVIVKFSVAKAAECSVGGRRS